MKRSMELWWNGGNRENDGRTKCKREHLKIQLVPSSNNNINNNNNIKSDTSNNRGTVTISKSFKQYLSNIPGKHKIK
jgi:hypothetical protein